MEEYRRLRQGVRVSLRFGNPRFRVGWSAAVPSVRLVLAHPAHELVKVAEAALGRQPLHLGYVRVERVELLGRRLGEEALPQPFQFGRLLRAQRHTRSLRRRADSQRLPLALGRVILAAREAGDLHKHGGQLPRDLVDNEIPSLADYGISYDLAAHAVALAEVRGAVTAGGSAAAYPQRQPEIVTDLLVAGRSASRSAAWCWTGYRRFRWSA